MILSVADSKSTSSTLVLLPRAATMAASLHMLAMSAPTKSGVRAASRDESGWRDDEASPLSLQS